MLKEHGVQDPAVVLMFPYGPAGLDDTELELWSAELWRNYLHWLIQNAVAAEMKGNRSPA